MPQDRPISANKAKRPPTLDLASIWFAYRRRWFSIAFLGLALCAGAGYGVWRFLPAPKASAYVVYEISATEPALMSRFPDEREFNSLRQQQTNIVKRRSVLSTILTDSKVAEIKEIAESRDPIQWLEDNLKVDFKLGREYLRVSVDLPRADDAMYLVKTMHAAFFDEAVLKSKRGRSKRVEQLRKSQAERAQTLDAELAKLRELAEKGGAASEKIAAAQREYIRKTVSQLQSERANLSAEIRRLKIDLSTQTESPGKGAKDEPPEHAVKALIDADPTLKMEREALVELERVYENYRDSLAPGASTPRLVELRDAVAVQKKKVQELPAKLRADAVETARGKLANERAATKEALAARLKTAELLEKKLVEDEKKETEGMKNLGETQYDFDRSRVSINLLEKQTEHLAATVGNLEIELDAPDRVTLFEEPAITIPDDRSRRIKMAAGAALFGLLLGAAPLWLLELRRRIFHEESQLLELVPIPLVGTIPNIPRKRRASARDAVASQPRMRALVTESIDSTRATVLFNLQQANGRTLMVTSAVAGEAKSSVSGHISISLARAGFRTLLIDSDMRRPTLHRVFGVKKGPGFSDVLLGSKSLTETLQQSQLQNLTLLSAGEWSPAASSCLASGAWIEILMEAREDFDLVVVDAPPVLLVSDALTMARDVDAVLCSALRDVSEIDLINKSIEKLESLGITPMGLVASGVSHRMYKSRYYDRYAAAYSRRAKA